MAEQAKILVAEVEENKLGDKVWNERWNRWVTCSLCEQRYHGVVRCALGWACWKTYVSRPERDQLRRPAMGVLGNGLYDARRHEDALSVGEAELAMERRLGAPEEEMLRIQSNLASTYAELGRLEEALSLRREVYSVCLKLFGEHVHTFRAASNYASLLEKLQRYQEAKSLLRRTIPVARRVLGESHEVILKMRWVYAEALHEDDSATLDDIREAMTTLEETARIAQRVLGGAHPLTVDIERELRRARYALRAREESDVCNAMAAMAPGDA